MSPEIEPTPTKRDIESLFDAIQRRGAATRGELLVDTGIPRATLVRYLNQLVKANRIVRKGGGRSIYYRVLGAGSNPSASIPPPIKTSQGEANSAEPPSGSQKKDLNAWFGLITVVLLILWVWRWVEYRQVQPEKQVAATPSSSPQGEGLALAVPVPNGNRPSSPISQVQAPAPTQIPTPVPAQRHAPRPVAVKAAQKPPIKASNQVVHNAPVSMDASFARAFTLALYNQQYQDPYANADSVTAMLGGSHGQEIVDNYYSEERIKKIQDEKETFAFEPAPNPLLTLTKDGEEDFRVTGVLTITEEGQSHIDRRDLVLLVTIGHDAQGRPEVRDIIEVYSKEMK